MKHGRLRPPKKTSGDDMPKKPNRVTVKIDRDLWHKATTIAHANGLDLAEYLSEKLRPPIIKDYPKAIARLADDGDALPDGAGPKT